MLSTLLHSVHPLQSDADDPDKNLTQLFFFVFLLIFYNIRATMSLRGFGNTIRDVIPHFDGTKLRRRKSRALPSTSEGTRHRSFGSIFSFADSIKANVASATGSVRVTNRERRVVRAQDIFYDDSVRYVFTTSVRPDSHQPFSSQ